MFFLPLPLNKTLETIQEIQSSNCPHITLPNPELYIIVNGRPTKSKVVWRSLVNINHVKAAIKTLKSCNWLYKHVHKESIDESTKNVPTMPPERCLKRLLPQIMMLSKLTQLGT